MAPIQDLKGQQEALREEIAGLEAQLKSKGEKIRPWIERRITRIRQEEGRLNPMKEKIE
ncbi:MAG: hypothetical protein WD425_07365 [Nitrospirales bacterium]